MAYTDKRGMTPARFWAIVIVVIIHIFLGYAFVTGLAYNVVKKVAKDLKTFDVQEEPPPPEELPPPPPPDKPLPPPPVTLPPPIVQTQSTTPPPVFAPQPPPVFTPQPVPVPAPPPPPPKPVVATRAVPRGGAGAIDNSFYPSSAIRNEEQGTSVASFVIGADGRVQSCNASGATPTLDAETCRQILKWRYKPAQDASGQPIAQPMRQNVRWVLPKD